MKKYLAMAALATTVAAAPAWAALTAGATAPDFTLTAYKAGVATQFDLSAELEKGPVVLYFFPGAYTPGCNVEAQQFAESIAQFRAAGAQVVGVTGGFGSAAAESEFSNLNDAVQAFSETHCNGEFPVIAADAAVINNYDVALTQRPGWSNRTSFVIGQDGKIKLSHTDARPDSHITETLEAVNGL